jgi:hypothetical protein
VLFAANGFELGEPIDSGSVDDVIERCVTVGEVRPAELGLVLVGEYNFYGGVSTKRPKNILPSSRRTQSFGLSGGFVRMSRW